VAAVAALEAAVAAVDAASVTVDVAVPNIDCKLAIMLSPAPPLCLRCRTLRRLLPALLVDRFLLPPVAGVIGNIIYFNYILFF
jgi:hypothetical protein